MNEELEAVCRALDALAGAITSGWSGDQTFCEAWGWNCPAVTRHEAAQIAASLAAEIRAANIPDVDEETSEFLGDLPRKLKVAQTQIIPQFWGGNNGAAYASYVGTITSIRASLQPLLGWKTIPDPKSLPGHTARRLQSIQAEVEALAPNKDQLRTQLQEIAEAHSVAENLPLDLKALADARQKVVSHAEAAEAAAKRIDIATEASSEDVRMTKLNAAEAAQLVAQCEEAYRITTTKGLGPVNTTAAHRRSVRS